MTSQDKRPDRYSFIGAFVDALGAFVSEFRVGIGKASAEMQPELAAAEVEVDALKDAVMRPQIATSKLSSSRSISLFSVWNSVSTGQRHALTGASGCANSPTVAPPTPPPPAPEQRSSLPQDWPQTPKQLDEFS